jgi:hypothetical protein
MLPSRSLNTRRSWPTRSGSRCWSCSTRSLQRNGPPSSSTTSSPSRFERIAPIAERTAPTMRQLASRARRRVHGHAANRDSGRLRQAQLVDAFIAATRNVDFSALLGMLDTQIVPRADDHAAKLGAVDEIHGAAQIALAFSRRARDARPAPGDRSCPRDHGQVSRRRRAGPPEQHPERRSNRAMRGPGVWRPRARRGPAGASAARLSPLSRAPAGQGQW